MRISIFAKLFISLFVTSVLLVISMTLFVSYNFKMGLQSYQNQVEEQQVIRLTTILGESYSPLEGWNNIRRHPETLANAFIQLNMTPPLPDRPGLPPMIHHTELEWLTPVSQRINILDIDKNLVVGQPTSNIHRDELIIRELPIYSNSNIVGWIKLQQRSRIEGPIIERFYEQQLSNLFWFISLAGLSSFLVALILVRRFLLPLKQLKQGAHSLSQGDYEFQFQTHDRDEFGELASGFQYLADSLKNNKITREQWITDISHELRTPVSVLRGELEAIQDRIRQPNDKNINSMHHQVMVLSRLIDDLYQLSKSDSGAYQVEVTNISLPQLLERVVSRFEHRADEKGLVIELLVKDKTVVVAGDENLLEQLWVNILENSLRYTDAPGVIRWKVERINEDIIIQCEDSSPSVNEAHLPKIFERLYRVDKSRSRLFGGSGLGLSICKNIVTMHDGDILAKRSILGGLMIEISLKGAD